MTAVASRWSIVLNAQRACQGSPNLGNGSSPTTQPPPPKSWRPFRCPGIVLRFSSSVLLRSWLYEQIAQNGVQQGRRWSKNRRRTRFTPAHPELARQLFPGWGTLRIFANRERSAAGRVSARRGGRVWLRPFSAAYRLTRWKLLC